MKIDFHTHVHFENYNPEKLLEAMKRNNIRAAGLAGYNRDSYWDNILAFKKAGLNVEFDDLLCKVKKDGDFFYFPRINEWENKDGFHLLVLGNQKGLSRGNCLEKNIEKALENECLPSIEHTFVNINYADISKKQEEIVLKICEKYNGKIAIGWNGYSIPCLKKAIDVIISPARLIGKDIRFSDTNAKLENFHKYLSYNKINCPIIADTDLHARYEKDLNLIGTSDTDILVRTDGGKGFRDSFKQELFSGGYTINKGYVPIKHFMVSYAIPWVLGNLSKEFHIKLRPRG